MKNKQMPHSIEYKKVSSRSRLGMAVITTLSLLLVVYWLARNPSSQTVETIREQTANRQPATNHNLSHRGDIYEKGNTIENGIIEKMKEQVSDPRSVERSNESSPQKPGRKSTGEEMDKLAGSSKSSLTPESDPVDSSALKLEGLYKSPNPLNSRAIIGKRFYAEGETVQDTQLRILTVTNDHIVLKNGRGEQERLDLEVNLASESTELSSLDPEKKKQVYAALGKARNMGLLYGNRPF